jgi:hypothetical protein
MTATVAKLQAQPSKRPVPDFSKGVDATGIWSPSLLSMTASQSIVVGGSISGGMRVSGLVRRIVTTQDGLTWVIVQLGQVSLENLKAEFGALYFSVGGMLGELNSDMYEQLTEANCGPFPPMPSEVTGWR